MTSFMNLSRPSSQNFDGGYTFLSAPTAPYLDGKINSEPWTVPSSSGASPGVSSTHMEPLITFQLMAYEPSNYTTSEPIFGILAANLEGIVKVYTLAELNDFLQRQHKYWIEKMDTRKRKYSTLTAEELITEKNFSEKIAFIGFVADTSHNSLGQSRDDHGPTTKLLTIHSKGKLDCAYLWGSGKRKIGTQTGDHVAFVVKRMNKVDNIVSNTKDLKDFIENIGPLQVLPIASRRREMFNFFTIGAIGADNLLYNLRGSSYRNGEGLPVESFLFDNIKDDYHTDAYHRGTAFATVDNIEEIYTADPRITSQITPIIKEGLVISAGYIMGVFSEPPPSDNVAKAISYQNGFVSKIMSERKFYKNGVPTNIAHALLQDDYGIHLFVHLSPSSYYWKKQFDWRKHLDF
jgi:hypothetical protein